MADDPRALLQKQLDLLLSVHREEVGDRALAEVLFAAANGLVSLLRDHARYDAADSRVTIPFVDASQLEEKLEDLLTTRAICMHVTPSVPMHQDLEIRILCGDDFVDLKGRAVQVMPTGTVFQLEPATVDVQRALVSLPATLRSNPSCALEIDQKASRPPMFVDPAPAREQLFGAPVAPAKPEVPEPEPPPAPAPASRSHMTTPRPPKLEQREVFVEPPEPSEPSLVEETEHGHDKIAASRLAFQLPKVDGALARAVTRNHFEFLNVHFSADFELVQQAREELMGLIEQCRADDVEDTAAERLDALTARVEEAWEVLRKTSTRRAHRKQMVPAFQVEAALELYIRQAEAAKMSRRYDVAIDCLRSVVELDPTNDNARVQLEAIQAMTE